MAQTARNGELVGAGICEEPGCPAVACQHAAPLLTNSPPQIAGFGCSQGHGKLFVQNNHGLFFCVQAIITCQYFCNSVSPLPFHYQLHLHMHNPPILHRDFKSPNLLVGQHFEVKVCHLSGPQPVRRVVLEDGAHRNLLGHTSALLLLTLLGRQQGIQQRTAAQASGSPGRSACCCNPHSGLAQCRCVTSTSPKCWRWEWCPASPSPIIHGECACYTTGYSRRLLCSVGGAEDLVELSRISSTLPCWPSRTPAGGWHQRCFAAKHPVLRAMYGLLAS